MNLSIQCVFFSGYYFELYHDNNQLSTLYKKIHTRLLPGTAS